jgi:hypothetical protein
LACGLSQIDQSGVCLGFPHIDAAGDAAFPLADELLAHKTFGFQETGRDCCEMFAAFLKTNRRRQVIENDGGNHRRVSLILFRSYQAAARQR